MWSALENVALRESLPVPLSAGDSIHGIRIAGQLDRGRHNLHHLGRRRSVPYLLKQFYGLDADAFLRWQNEARFIGMPPAHGFVWPCAEWRGGVISPFPDGVPMDRWLLLEPRTTEAKLGAAAELARRVARLHRSGIRHRNISPHSIWIGDDTLTLTDFGSARCDWWDDFWADSPFTDGCPDFTSPESLLGRECDQAHDVYSFGMTLYLLLTGRPPFRTFKRLLRPILPGAIPPDALPRTEDIPDGIRELTKACMAAAPHDRPTSFEVAVNLEAYGTRGHAPEESIQPPKNEPTPHEKRRVMVFVKDNIRAVSVFDAVINAATETPSVFLFVSLIPGNLPSGHLERFKGGLFRKIGHGLLRCRQRNLEWSLRVLGTGAPEATAKALVTQYAPDTIILGYSQAKGRHRRAFQNNLSGSGIHINKIP